MTCRIVGKGNHSANHVQKIKPRVEQVCRELGLQYATEENAGRIYVNLTGGPAEMPPSTFLGTILLIFSPIFFVFKTGMVLGFVALFESYMIAFKMKEEKEAVLLGELMLIYN